MDGAFGIDDAHYFLDLDMAVLGSSPDSYAEYRERIRGEYSFLSEPMYTALRLKVSFIKLEFFFSRKIRVDDFDKSQPRIYYQRIL